MGKKSSLGSSISLCRQLKSQDKKGYKTCMSDIFPDNPPPIVGSHPFAGVAVSPFVPLPKEEEKEELHVEEKERSEQLLLGELLPQSLPSIQKGRKSPFWGVVVALVVWWFFLWCF